MDISKNVRFGKRQYALVEREAAREGVPVSAYIRAAAYGRAVWSAAEDGDPEGRLVAQIVRLLGRVDPAFREKLAEQLLELEERRLAGK